MHKLKKYLIISAILSASFSISFMATADTLGQNTQFYVNSKFDYSGRNQLNATLKLVSVRVYFYVEDQYWNGLSVYEQNTFLSNINSLAQEFDNNIYPKETAFWGSENKPGLDNDLRITILLERLAQNTGGYFESINNYPTSTFANSNQREMVFINAPSLLNSTGRTISLLAHELHHLISLNQKLLLRSSREDTWLEELRAEYSIGLTGLNEPFNGSSLQNRVREFLLNPSDSLTEWRNQSSEYGSVALFGQYMTEQYGPSILQDSFQSSVSGISSINAYLGQNNYRESFGDVFANWTIANYLNDLSVDSHYGYQKLELKNIHVTPVQNNLFYPFTYVYDYSLKPWQPAWYRFNLSGLPASKSIKLDLKSSSTFGFIYIDSLGRKQTSGNSFYITNPEGNLSYFTLMPNNQSKIGQFSDNDPTSTISVNISFVETIPPNAVIVGTSSTVITTPSGVPEGALIRRVGEKDLYVITGSYKRYMSPLAISLYGHLDPTKAYEVSPQVFDSYPVSNYIRTVNTSQIYAVWPDNTKHLFKIDFIASGRDPNLIFTINPLEFNIYKTGVPILR